MANCPKCGVHLKLTDWRQHCPRCGANIVVYDLQERLMQQADVAEVQHYHFQKKIDRLKASFVGSKLAVVRIITSFIPVFALFLPMVNCRLNPALGDFEGNGTERSGASGDEVGGLAQLGERLPCKQEVSGSIPLISTKRANSSAG